MTGNRIQFRSVWIVGLLTALSPLASADDFAANAARLEQMSAEQKEELSRKRLRFDELSASEQQRLRSLYGMIAADANADELLSTVTRYNRWLSTLEAAERSTLLDIKDPKLRIARMKELMQQQEERRFKQYFANLPSEDRQTIYKWLAEFVVRRADEIVERLPPHIRQRWHDEGDEVRRREMLFGNWQRYRREFNLPGPSQEDYDALFEQFSSETQKAVASSATSALNAEPEDQRTPQRLQALQRMRMEDIVRTAIYSRFFRQISQDELMRFYNAMKTNDPRRRMLEGKEGEELRRELQRIYNFEQMGGRGGPPGSGGRGFGPNWPPPREGRPEVPPGDDSNSKPPPEN